MSFYEFSRLDKDCQAQKVCADGKVSQSTTSKCASKDARAPRGNGVINRRTGRDMCGHNQKVTEIITSP